MPKVVLSTDQNIEYLFYAPITCFVWEYFGFKPMLLVLGKSKYTNLVYEYIKNYTSSEIVEIEPISPYKDCTVVQFSRLYASCFEKNENEYLLTGDIDMLILNKYLYRDFDKMNLFGSDLTGFVHHPICYIGMTTDKWRKLLNLDYDKFNENIIRDLQYDGFGTSQNFNEYWYTDQRFITKKIRDFDEKNFNIILRGHVNLIANQRIDRICWNFNPNQDYIDCHLLKNGYLKQNFEKVFDIIKNKVGKDSSWMIEYFNKFNEIKNKL